jgi:hypothetical protein
LPQRKEILVLGDGRRERERGKEEGSKNKKRGRSDASAD